MRDGVVPQLDLHGQIRHSLVVARGRLAVVSPPDVEVSLLFFCGEFGPVSSRCLLIGGRGGQMGGWPVEEEE